MKIVLLIYALLIISCSSKFSLPRIEEMPDSSDIIINHNWNSEDSLDIYIPYKFKIYNESDKKILFDEISVWGTHMDHDFKYFDENGNSLNFLNNKSSNYILPESGKVIYVYLKVTEGKGNIPGKYWKDIKKEELVRNKDKFPKKSTGLVNMEVWKKRRENDTISFRFNGKDKNDLFIYYSLKTKSTKAYTAREIAEKYLRKGE